MEPLFPIPFEDGVDSVIYGREILKLGNWGEPHLRRFFLDRQTMQDLVWISPVKNNAQSRIKLSTIKSFAFGYKEKLFQKQGPIIGDKGDLALTITFTNEKGNDSILSVVFKNKRELQAFSNGLQYFVMCEKFGLASK